MTENKRTYFDENGLSLLKTLCNSFGVSGYESETADIIIEKITPHCDSVMTDAVGNVIAMKKGLGANNTKEKRKKIMLCAHMDEVGFAVKNINDDGTLSADEVGISPTVLPSQRVLLGRERLPGVFNAPPPHLREDKTKPVTMRDLTIDVGFGSKKEAEDAGLLGVGVCFDSDFVFFGDGLVKAKALDDRIGCAVLIMLAEEEFDEDVYFVFTTGEELGGVGAAAAVNRIKPDLCIIAEGTTASDIDGTPEKDKVCRLRHGAVCPFMDGGTIYDEELYTCIHEYAKEKDIKIQTKTKIAGGTDGARIQRSLCGVKTAAVSLPCRYIHTSSSVAAIEDMESMARLISGVCKKLCSGIQGKEV